MVDYAFLLQRKHTGNPFEWLFGETMLYNPPSPILHCIRLLGDSIAGRGY